MPRTREHGGNASSAVRSDLYTDPFDPDPFAPDPFAPESAFLLEDDDRPAGRRAPRPTVGGGARPAAAATPPWSIRRGPGPLAEPGPAAAVGAAIGFMAGLLVAAVVLLVIVGGGPERTDAGTSPTTAETTTTTADPNGRVDLGGASGSGTENGLAPFAAGSPPDPAAPSTASTSSTVEAATSTTSPPTTAPATTSTVATTAPTTTVPSSVPTSEQPAPQPAPAPGPDTSADAGVQQEVLALTNAERAAAGCGALTLDPALNAAADGHSEDMAVNDYFSHTDRNGNGPGVRARAAGYPGGAVGENIAVGYRSAASVVQGWMDSPGHRANILNCRYTHLGVGYAEGPSASRGYAPLYWTQVFGG